MYTWSVMILRLLKKVVNLQSNGRFERKMEHLHPSLSSIRTDSNPNLSEIFIRSDLLRIVSDRIGFKVRIKIKWIFYFNPIGFIWIRTCLLLKRKKPHWKALVCVCVCVCFTLKKKALVYAGGTNWNTSPSMYFQLSVLRYVFDSIWEVKYCAFDAGECFGYDSGKCTHPTSYFNHGTQPLKYYLAVFDNEVCHYLVELLA